MLGGGRVEFDREALGGGAHAAEGDAGEFGEGGGVGDAAPAVEGLAASVAGSRSRVDDFGEVAGVAGGQQVGAHRAAGALPGALEDVSAQVQHDAGVVGGAHGVGHVGAQPVALHPHVGPPRAGDRGDGLEQVAAGVVLDGVRGGPGPTGAVGGGGEVPADLGQGAAGLGALEQGGEDSPGGGVDEREVGVEALHGLARGVADRVDHGALQQGESAPAAELDRPGLARAVSRVVAVVLQQVPLGLLDAVDDEGDPRVVPGQQARARGVARVGERQRAGAVVLGLRLEVGGVRQQPEQAAARAGDAQMNGHRGSPVRSGRRGGR